MTWREDVPCPKSVKTLNEFSGEKISVVVPLGSCSIEKKVRVSHDFGTEKEWDTFYFSCPKTICDDWEFPK